jgi:hypothetical protein
MKKAEVTMFPGVIKELSDEDYLDLDRQGLINHDNDEDGEHEETPPPTPDQGAPVSKTK